MPPTGNTPRLADCTNTPQCSLARAARPVEWYPGAGEYCPECGETLVPRPVTMPPAGANSAPAAPAATPQTGSGPATAPNEAPSASGASIAAPAAAASASQTTAAKPKSNGRRTAADAPPAATKTNGRSATTVPPRPIIPSAPPTADEVADHSVARGPKRAPRWPWIVAVIFIVSGALGYAVYRGSGAATPEETVSVCAIPGAKQLASELVSAYAAESRTPESRFVVGDASTCDVRIARATDSPAAVIASDGIVAVVNPLNGIARVSEKELRGIFSGTIRDWSQLGQPLGPIVPILPDAGSDEVKALDGSLLIGMQLGANVRRAGSSADVTRTVTGADRESRAAIGLVAFSQAVPAKVVPLAYLPAPSVLSIASHRYPYTLSISVDAGTDHPSAAASGLIAYARSSYGAAIVQANGLVPREGL